MSSALTLCWIGKRDPDGSLLVDLCTHLGSVFRAVVDWRPLANRPSEAWDPARKQLSSSRLIDWLSREGPADRPLLGVTDEDLFIPVLTYVFGEAQLGGRVAVVSTARLHPPPFATSEGARRLGSAARTLLRERLAKECTHELGHVMGLVHCRCRGCAMARSSSVVEVDAKSDRLCDGCEARLGLSQRPEATRS